MVDAALFIELQVQPFEDPVEGAVPPPEGQPVVDGGELAIPLGQLPPLGPGVQHPEDAVEDGAVVLPLAAPLAGRGQEVLDQLVLLVGQLIAARHGGLRSRGPAMVTTSDSTDRT
jgi:hypothetical protein